MKVLIIDKLHHKNRSGIEMILKYANYDYTFSNYFNNIDRYDDIIYSCSDPIDTSMYPEKKFIFGPHFSVFPDDKLKRINNVYNNAIYIQPSEWCVNLWKNYDVTKYLPITRFNSGPNRFVHWKLWQRNA